MDRRSTLLAMGGVMGGAALPFAFARAQGQGGTAGIGFGAYRKSTLQYGSLAKLTSVYAAKTSADPYVQDFAHGEILEQDAVATALTSTANPAPPPLTPAQQAMLNQVSGASVGQVDAIYIKVQIAGHEALLKLQDQLLAEDTNLSADLVHIALIARAFILNHLLALRVLTGQPK